MGVYDFFKGTCPNCKHELDEHPKYGKCGDIQTKVFIDYNQEETECFRDFKPGCKVPFAPKHNFIIGRTCCCNTLLSAIFEGNTLLRYEIVVINDNST